MPEQTKELKSRMNQRDGKIEALRFFASITIMIGHMHRIGLGELERPFANNWIYVEFFLFLSGFFVAQHFSVPKDNQSVTANAISYTLNKYKRFLPYVLLAVLTDYLVLSVSFVKKSDWNGLFTTISDMPAEMFFLSAANTNGTRLGAIWFLSATFLVFPLVSIIAQFKDKKITCLVAFYPAVLYYLNKTRSIGDHTYPNQMIRAFCGMCVGIVLFYITDYINNRKSDRVGKVTITLLQIISYIVPVVLGYYNRLYENVFLACFMISISLTFCRHSLLPSMSNKVLLYLGKISMPLFIWHMAIADVVNVCYKGTSSASKIFLFFGGSIIVAAVHLLINDLILANRKIRKK